MPHRERLIGQGRKAARHYRSLFYLWVFFPFVHQAQGFFLGNTKAVLQGCQDQWTLRDSGRVPILYQLTVCVDVRVLTPGEWTAFSYMSPRWGWHDLALQGDESALYAWLLGVRHHFPAQLPLHAWHHLCLRRDAPRNSFSLEVNGSAGTLETTAIAGAMPAGGNLLLGCQRREASPGVTAASLELYMFRMWADVKQHEACEEGTIAGWDSSLWSVSRPQASTRDDTLQCGMSNLLVQARFKRSNMSQQGAMHSANGNPATGITSTRTTANTRTSSTAVFTTTSRASTPTTTTSTTAAKSTTTASAQLSVTRDSHLPSISSALQAKAETSASLRRVSSLTTPPPSPLTVKFPQASTSRGPAVVVQCNSSQFCDNTTSYYWMLVSVAVLPGTSKTLQDVQNWFSDVFSGCGPSETSDAYSNDTFGKPAACQNISTGKFQTINVDCEVKKDFNKTTCTVVFGWSERADTCSISHLFQESRDQSLSAQLLGNVHRVGKDLCLDELMLPPGGGFVQCKSSMPYPEVCDGEAHVNITCSYEKSFIPQELTEEVVQPCSSQEQQYCDCGVFCKNSGAFYAFNISINSPDATFTDVKNIITKLDSPCDLAITPQSLCNNISMVFHNYQGVHIQCYGNGTRLYSCMVALQLRQSLDVCTVSGAVGALVRSSPNVTYDGVLSRIALCGLHNDSMTDLLNSTFTWVWADLDAQNICQISDFRSLTSQFMCGEGQVLSVLLNERCAVPPFPIGFHLNQTTPSTNTEPVTAFPSQPSVALDTSSPAKNSSVSTWTIRPNTLQNNTLGPVVKPSNTTTAPSTGEPPLNSTLMLRNANTLANNTDTTSTSVGVTYPPLNMSHNTAFEQLGSTSLPNSMTGLQPTQLKTTQPNSFSSQLTADFNKTISPLNTALLNTTTLSQNTLHLNTTTLLSSITKLKTATDTNATQFSTVNSENTTQFSTVHSENTAQFSTVHSENTTQIPTSYNSTTVSQNVSHSNVTVPHINTTLANSRLNTTFTNTAFTNSSLNTTMVPLNTAQYNTTMHPNATSSTNTVQPKTALPQFNTPFYNVTELKITVANATDANTMRSPFYTTNPIRDTTLNTTMNQLNSAIPLSVTTLSVNSSIQNTTLLPLNLTELNTTFIPLNTTLLPLNITELNTTFIPLNTTLINITVSQNATRPSDSNVSLSTREFNATTPLTTTTQINTTAPPRKSINFTSEAFTTNYTGTTLNTTLMPNDTLDKNFTQNITSNFTTLNMTSYINNTQQESSLPLNMTLSPLATTRSTSKTTPFIKFNTTTSRPDNATGNHSSISGGSEINPQTTIGNSTVLMRTSTTPPSVGHPLPVQTTASTTTTVTSTVTATNTTMSLDFIADQLLNQTENVAVLNSSQVAQLVRKIEDLLSRPNISVPLAKKILSVINNLLNCSTSILATSSNRLIRAVDELGMKLVVQDKTEEINLDSIALVVTKIDGTKFPGISFSMMAPSGPVVKSRSRRSVTTSLASSTLPASIIDSIPLETRPLASRVYFTFFQKNSLFNDTSSSLQLITPVVGASMANLSITGLRDNVEISLLNRMDSTGRNLTCVFWDFGQNGGLGGWNQSGCSVVQNASTPNMTVCSCNHLTSFGVLMDISRGGITSRAQATILTFITYIGCGISAIFLAVTVLTYLAFEKLRRDIPSKILINLCIALLLLNLVFLLDAWLALYKDAVGLCISTAFFLHYFLLASFTWMGLEALHLYLAIVKVFNNSMSRYMLKFTLTGWGIPLLVVIIVIAVSKDNYGLISYGKFGDNDSDVFCWLKNDIAFYVSVVAYFCVIFVSNLVTFVMVMVQLRRIKRQNPHNNQFRSGFQDLRSVAGLTVLLGLTWGFAFFAWGPVNLAFMYLFCIFNTLQGFLIFVFHCAIKENVRRQWRIYLCCGKLRLAENSDWSRTATNTKKTSLATATSSRGSQTQSTSRSSSLTTSSNPSSVLNSPVEERMFIGLDNSSDDVVLNEINSPNRSVYRPA